MINKKPVCLTIDKKLYEQYQEFCKAVGFGLSSRLSILMERDLNENKANYNPDRKSS